MLEEWDSVIESNHMFMFIQKPKTKKAKVKTERPLELVKSKSTSYHISLLLFNAF